MGLKKFKDFQLNENILDDIEDEDENTNKWEVRVNDKLDSYWEYKHDAIDRIVEILDTEGSGTGLDNYMEDDNELSKNEIADILDDLSEEEFYDMLGELKEWVEYGEDIILRNIADDDEIEFLI